jgi:hypothetical protein
MPVEINRTSLKANLYINAVVPYWSMKVHGAWLSGTVNGEKRV